MITSSQQERELPFLRTLLCVFSAATIASFVTSFLFLGRAYSLSNPSPVMVIVNLLLSAAIGAVILRYLLAPVVDYEIPYGASVVALLAGSAASTVVRLVFLHGLGGGASTALRPVALIPFFPFLVGGSLTWWLLQSALRSPSPPALAGPPSAAVPMPAGPQQTRVFDDPHAGDPTATAYAETVLAVRESALGLVGTVNSVGPDSVPSVIANGLLPYEAATRRLEQAELPSAVPAALNQRLLAGLKQLEDDLTLTAEDAATTAGTRLYQRGLLSASMADVSDGGARYRWDLEQSEGLKAVEHALSELRALGFGGT